MKKIKIPIDTFVTLREKNKFLEHYWSLYTSQNQNYAAYEHASVVEEFIRTRFFDKVDSFKVNSFTKTVSLSRPTFNNLKKYAHVSDHLATLVDRQNSHLN